jgi:hypothetical protein
MMQYYKLTDANGKTTSVSRLESKTKNLICEIFEPNTKTWMDYPPIAGAQFGMGSRAGDYIPIDMEEARAFVEALGGTMECSLSGK